MRHALLKAGIVVNVIELDDPKGYTPAPGLALVASAEAQIGQVYDGTRFLPPPASPVAEKEAALRALEASDAETGGRAAEALIAALTAKGVIADGDLPAELRALIAKREAPRDALRR